MIFSIFDANMASTRLGTHLERCGSKLCVEWWSDDLHSSHMEPNGEKPVPRMDFRYCGPVTRDQGPGPGTKDPGPGTRDQGPGARDQDQGPGPGTGDQGPGTLALELKPARPARPARPGWPGWQNPGSEILWDLPWPYPLSN